MDIDSKNTHLPSLLVDVKEGVIDLGWGHPSASLHPLNLIKHAADKLLERNDTTPLQYGAAQGFGPFLNSLARFLSSQPGYFGTVLPGQLFLTAGASQAIDLACTLMTTSGDTVIVEEPTYFVVEKIFRDHDLEIVGVPIDKNGMQVSELRKKLESGLRPSFVYTIPTYQNPTGVCTSVGRKKELIKLSEEFDFLIFADEVYQLMNFDQLPPAPYMSLDHRDRVVSFGSFSKILAPGLRTGWIHCSEGMVAKFSDAAVTFSGGGFNHFASTLIKEVIDLGFLAENINALKKEYSKRSESMDFALTKYFGDLISYTVPSGGYYYWLDFDLEFDTQDFLPYAELSGVSYRPGNAFSESQRFGNCLRLTYTLFESEQLQEGVKRLYSAYTKFRKC